MDIVYSTTIELATAIQSRRLSSLEVVDAYLAQIERHNRLLNAVVILEAEQARLRAREADAALARGELWGPLHGVPYTLKDAHSTKGMRTTVGFPPFANLVPQEDSTVAARLKSAGAILMGKSNVHTLLGDPLQSINPIFGRTSNPWDHERTAGGSSGGAAAAVAAGMTPFDIGTDLAGSVRIPAHFCGLFGLKPTEHRISLAGLVPDPRNLPRTIRIMSSIGPLARTVDDLELLFRILAGPDSRDSDVPPVALEQAPAVDLKSLRIAFAPNFAGLPVASEISVAISTLVKQLARSGAIVEEAPLPQLDFSSDLERTGALIGMMLGALEAQEGETPTTLAQYFAALDQRDRSILAWERFFTQWDVLITPPAMVTAFPHREPGTPLSVDGQEMTYWLGNAHSILFNYTGNPAIVLPYLHDNDGMPIGVQVVGKRWDDIRLLAIARAIAGITGTFQRPPGY